MCLEAGHPEAYFVINHYIRPWKEGNFASICPPTRTGHPTSAIKTMDIDEIRRLVRQGRYEFSIHAQQERLEEDLDVTEIEAALVDGEILEAYPDDPRGESCLVLGAGTKSIHVVLGWADVSGEGERILRVITVYIPQPPKWSDPRTRGIRP
jgi:hypothetical protein